MLRILGIDPGSRKTGIGIIDYDSSNRHATCVFATVLRLDLEQELPVRMGELAELLQEILAKYQPKQAILEDVFVGEHTRSALILGQARGAALAILGLAKIPVISMAPRKVKQAITGHGQANKAQAAEMVRILLKLDKKPAEDAADALALALACVLTPIQAHTPKRLGSGQKRKALYDIAKAQGKI
ncbi:MAG: crossover junction endodeoxyribonuclease RuvC [Myxococcaceae bacterium]